MISTVIRTLLSDSSIRSTNHYTALSPSIIIDIPPGIGEKASYSWLTAFSLYSHFLVHVFLFTLFWQTFAEKPVYLSAIPPSWFLTAHTKCLDTPAWRSITTGNVTITLVKYNLLGGKIIEILDFRVKSRNYALTPTRRIISHWGHQVLCEVTSKRHMCKNSHLFLFIVE